MKAKLPVIACTDNSSDVGAIIKEGGFGWWCESNSADAFDEIVCALDSYDLGNLGNNAFNYLLRHYSVEQLYSIIMSGVNLKK